MRKLIIAILIVSVAFAGCTGDGGPEATNEISDGGNGGNQTDNPDQASVGDGSSEDGSVDVQRFSVGEAVTDGDLTVQVNSVKYVRHLPSDNVFLEETAPSGKRYAVIDVAIRNERDESVTVSSLLSMELVDGQGYSYEPNLLSSSYEQGFSSGSLTPGEKRRGRVIFEVPVDAEGLRFQFSFDLYGSTKAIYELPDKETWYSVDFQERPDPEGSISLVNVDARWIGGSDIGSGSISSAEINIKNTGKIGFEPAVGIEVKQGSSTVHSSSGTLSLFEDLEPGQTHTDTVIPAVILEEQGSYEVVVKLREKGSTELLAQDSTTIQLG